MLKLSNETDQGGYNMYCDAEITQTPGIVGPLSVHFGSNLAHWVKSMFFY